VLPSARFLIGPAPVRSTLRPDGGRQRPTLAICQLRAAFRPKRKPSAGTLSGVARQASASSGDKRTRRVYGFLLLIVADVLAGAFYVLAVATSSVGCDSGSCPDSANATLGGYLLVGCLLLTAVQLVLMLRGRERR